MKEVRSYYGDDGSLLTQETIVTCNMCGRRLSVDENLKPYIKINPIDEFTSVLSTLPVGCPGKPLYITTKTSFACDKCIDKLKSNQQK